MVLTGFYQTVKTGLVFTTLTLSREQERATERARERAQERDLEVMVGGGWLGLARAGYLSLFIEIISINKEEDFLKLTSNGRGQKKPLSKLCVIENPLCPGPLKWAPTAFSRLGLVLPSVPVTETLIWLVHPGEKL